MTARYMTICPAPWISCATEAEVLAALAEGRDFVILDAVGPYGQWCGAYVNVTDLRLDGNDPPPPTHIVVRYAGGCAVASWAVADLPDPRPA
jgi:hypothetical protein